MLLYSLSIDVKEKLHKITSSDFRKFILALTDRFPNEIKSKINFHITDEAFRTNNQRKIPYIGHLYIKVPNATCDLKVA